VAPSLKNKPGSPSVCSTRNRVPALRHGALDLARCLGPIHWCGWWLAYAATVNVGRVFLAWCHAAERSRAPTDA
jgi:hypothetical protein